MPFVQSSQLPSLKDAYAFCELEAIAAIGPLSYTLELRSSGPGSVHAGSFSRSVIRHCGSNKNWKLGSNEVLEIELGFSPALALSLVRNGWKLPLTHTHTHTHTHTLNLRYTFWLEPDCYTPTSKGFQSWWLGRAFRMWSCLLF